MCNTWVDTDTHIQLESSDHSFLQLIQTVVYPLPPFPLDEWFPHLWGENNNCNNAARRRRHVKAWSKSIICSLYIRKYLSLFFSTRVFGWVVFHGWSSHVSNRSVRFCFLFPGSQRVFRALGAARPPYLSAEISMWMLQLFGCGIFPHTGSYQSRMIGHCLHSINHRPGPEKNPAGDRCPAWHRAARSTHHSTQFPLLPGMRNTWLSYISQWPETPCKNNTL